MDDEIHNRTATSIHRIESALNFFLNIIYIYYLKIFKFSNFSKNVLICLVLYLDSTSLRKIRKLCEISGSHVGEYEV
jgi:hypothetical protein